MRTAGNERDIVAGARELRAVVTADCARALNCDSNLFRYRGASPLGLPYALVAERLQYQYAGSPSARRPSPVKDSLGRSMSVFSTNAADAMMNTAGTIG